MMFVRKVVNVGNALYINIPKEVAEKLDIKENDSVVIVIVDSSIVIKKINVEETTRG